MMNLHLRVRTHGQLARLCGIEVESVEQFATVSRVPGSPFGMALVRSQIIPVIRLGDANGCLVVGRVSGEVFGVVGLDVVGLEREELPATESLAASNAHLVSVATWSAPASDANRPLEGERELDVEDLIATAKAQQRHRSQSSEERS